MAQVQGDDELHCFRQSKFFSITELAAFIGGGGSSVQFMEAANDTPTGTPADPTLPAFYLGNVNGTFYVWSILTATWIPIVSV